jgi:hypothetical protein
MAQVPVACTAHLHLVQLAALVAHWRGAADALQALRVGIQGAVAADLTEQARGEFGTGSGQRAEHAAVGMAGEERLDAAAIFFELYLQDSQLLDFGEQVELLGLDHVSGDVPLPGGL